MAAPRPLDTGNGGSGQSFRVGTLHRASWVSPLVATVVGPGTTVIVTADTLRLTGPSAKVLESEAGTDKHQAESRASLGCRGSRKQNFTRIQCAITIGTVPFVKSFRVTPPNINSPIRL